MPTPSLLIVPARFKTGTLYSQIPVPVAPSTSSVGDFTVTRNTAARRFDSAGLIASVASGIPRLDYYTSGGVTGCPALLVEPAGTNICLQSAGFEVSGTWGPENATITTGTTSAFTAPDGSTNADLLTDDATNGRHRVSQSNLPFTSGTTYTFSVFVKKNSSGRFLLINANTAIGARAALNLDTLAITNINGSGASVENYGNGWYRFLVRGTATSTQNTSVFIQMQDAATDSIYIGNGSSFYLWGAQLETGSIATSYIPTTTGTGSRSADVISVSGAVSGSIGQQSGTIYCEFQFNTPTVSTAGVLSVESTNDQNRILLWHNLTNNALGVQLRANNSNVFNTSIGTLTNGQIYKIAIGYSSGNTKVYLNGNSTAVITNTSAYTMAAALSRICLGNYENSAGTVTISRIRSFALYAERLTDAEMIALTTP